jgi:hypothetical protein
MILRRTILTLAVVAGLLVGAPAAGAATFTVNQTADTSDTSLADGVCDVSAAAGDQCTLRAAIEQGNNSATADTVHFSAQFDGPGGAVTDTIALGAGVSLPAIMQPLTVDGENCGTPPCAGIDAAGSSILTINAADTTIAGLSFKGASGSGPDRIALNFSTADRMVIRNDWFGLALDGTVEANRVSVAGLASDDAVIGGTTAADRNVFAAAAVTGLLLKNTDRARVQGNYFGTLADGTTLSGVAAVNQISLFSDAGAGGTQVGSLVGGPEAGSPGLCEAPCNVFAGGAIRLEASSGGDPPAGQTSIEGNFLGLSATGGALPTAEVKVADADDVTVGGDPSRRNYGGQITAFGGATNLDVIDNFVGLNPTGTARVTGTDGTIKLGLVGTPITGATVRGNRVATSAGTAIDLSAINSTVQGNVIGIGTGGENVGGGASAIVSFGGSGNQIGGSAGGDGNVIGNAGNGIFLGSPETGTTIAGNVIGTNTTETVPHPITSNGILVQGPNNVIGGTTAAGENVISNTTDGAIQIQFDNNDGNQILRNRGVANSAGPLQPFIDLNPANGPGATAVTSPNRGIQAPVIAGTPTAASISGTSEANATIRVYRTTDAAGASPLNVANFVGQATANGSGSWTLTCPSAGCAQQIQGGDRVAATQMDNLGNTSELSLATQYTDLVPDTAITGGPANGGVSNVSPTFTFASTEPASTFKCRIYPGTTPSGTFAACTGPAGTHTPAAPLAEGQFTFEVLATDSAAQPDPTPAARTFTVDATPPETTIDSGPAAGATIADSSASFGFSATEPGSTFECRVDSAAFAACSGPGNSHTTAPLAEDSHSFEVRAIDAAGNVDPSPASRSFTVDVPDPPPAASDKEPPETTITKAPKRKSFKRKAKFAFASDEPGSTFECRLDKGGFQPCGASAKFKVKAGKHKLFVRATDSAGNVDTTPASAKWKVRKRK